MFKDCVNRKVIITELHVHTVSANCSTEAKYTHRVPIDVQCSPSSNDCLAKEPTLMEHVGQTDVAHILGPVGGEVDSPPQALYGIVGVARDSPVEGCNVE